MISAISIVVTIAVLCVVYVLVKIGFGTYRKYRGVRVVTCPESLRSVAVKIKAGHAAAWSLIGKPKLELKDCSRWPERRNCGQQCISDIERAPEACLLRSILTEWYRAKKCALCGREFGKIGWLERRPALMNAEGKTFDWFEIAPERVYETLATHHPVCFDCHVAETFRRAYPYLVTDRPWRNDLPPRIH